MGWLRLRAAACCLALIASSVGQPAAPGADRKHLGDGAAASADEARENVWQTHGRIDKAYKEEDLTSSSQWNMRRWKQAVKKSEDPVLSDHLRRWMYTHHIPAKYLDPDVVSTAYVPFTRGVYLDPIPGVGSGAISGASGITEFNPDQAMDEHKRLLHEFSSSPFNYLLYLRRALAQNPSTAPFANAVGAGAEALDPYHFQTTQYLPQGWGLAAQGIRNHVALATTTAAAAGIPSPASYRAFDSQVDPFSARDPFSVKMAALHPWSPDLMAAGGIPNQPTPLAESGGSTVAPGTSGGAAAFLQTMAQARKASEVAGAMGVDDSAPHARRHVHELHRHAPPRFRAKRVQHQATGLDEEGDDVPTREECKKCTSDEDTVDDGGSTDSGSTDDGGPIVQEDENDDGGTINDNEEDNEEVPSGGQQGEGEDGTVMSTLPGGHTMPLHPFQTGLLPSSFSRPTDDNIKGKFAFMNPPASINADPRTTTGFGGWSAFDPVTHAPLGVPIYPPSPNNPLISGGAPPSQTAIGSPPVSVYRGDMAAAMNDVGKSSTSSSSKSSSSSSSSSKNARGDDVPPPQLLLPQMYPAMYLEHQKLLARGGMGSATNPDPASMQPGAQGQGHQNAFGIAPPSSAGLMPPSSATNPAHPPIPAAMSTQDDVPAEQQLAAAHPTGGHLLPAYYADSPVSATRASLNGVRASYRDLHKATTGKEATDEDVLRYAPEEASYPGPMGVGQLTGRQRQPGFIAHPPGVHPAAAIITPATPSQQPAGDQSALRQSLDTLNAAVQAIAETQRSLARQMGAQGAPASVQEAQTTDDDAGDGSESSTDDDDGGDGSESSTDNDDDGSSSSSSVQDEGDNDDTGGPTDGSSPRFRGSAKAKAHERASNKGKGKGIGDTMRSAARRISESGPVSAIRDARDAVANSVHGTVHAIAKAIGAHLSGDGDRRGSGHGPSTVTNPLMPHPKTAIPRLPGKADAERVEAEDQTVRSLADAANHLLGGPAARSDWDGARTQGTTPKDERRPWDANKHGRPLSNTLPDPVGEHDWADKEPVSPAEPRLQSDPSDLLVLDPSVDTLTDEEKAEKLEAMFKNRHASATRKFSFRGTTGASKSREHERSSSSSSRQQHASSTHGSSGNQAMRFASARSGASASARRRALLRARGASTANPLFDDPRVAAALAADNGPDAAESPFALAGGSAPGNAGSRVLPQQHLLEIRERLSGLAEGDNDGSHANDALKANLARFLSRRRLDAHARQHAAARGRATPLSPEEARRRDEEAVVENIRQASVASLQALPDLFLQTAASQRSKRSGETHQHQQQQLAPASSPVPTTPSRNKAAIVAKLAEQAHAQASAAPSQSPMPSSSPSPAVHPSPAPQSNEDSARFAQAGAEAEAEAGLGNSVEDARERLQLGVGTEKDVETVEKAQEEAVVDTSLRREGDPIYTRKEAKPPARTSPAPTPPPVLQALELRSLRDMRDVGSLTSSLIHSRTPHQPPAEPRKIKHFRKHVFAPAQEPRDAQPSTDLTRNLAHGARELFSEDMEEDVSPQAPPPDPVPMLDAKAAMEDAVSESGPRVSDPVPTADYTLPMPEDDPWHPKYSKAYTKVYRDMHGLSVGGLSEPIDQLLGPGSSRRTSFTSIKDMQNGPFGDTTNVIGVAYDDRVLAKLVEQGDVQDVDP